MNTKTFKFSTGDLIIDDSKISFHSFSGRIAEKNTIARENIGHVDKQNLRVLPKADVIYCIRILLIGIVLTILGVLVGASTGITILAWLGLLTFLFGGILFLASLYVDSMLGIRFSEKILLAIFGVNAVRVIMQNTYGGNSLIFLIKQEEQQKLPKLESYKLEKVYKIENIQKNDTGSQGINDLEKLAALKEKGVITEEEFNLKKKQILGL